MAKSLSELRKSKGYRVPFSMDDVPYMTKFYEKSRNDARMPKRAADEIRARLDNIEGHDAMTKKSMADIKRRKLQADAKAPGAGLYAKARAKLNEVTGFKKGGSTASKRADGCATKGKTKGRFV